MKCPYAAGVTLIWPSGHPMAASNPAETKIRSGLNS